MIHEINECLKNKLFSIIVKELAKTDIKTIVSINSLDIVDRLKKRHTTNETGNNVLVAMCSYRERLPEYTDYNIWFAHIDKWSGDSIMNVCKKHFSSIRQISIDDVNSLLICRNI